MNSVNVKKDRSKMANVIKYRLSCDGHPIGLFNTLDEAKYQASIDSAHNHTSLYFFDELELDRQGILIAINGRKIDNIVQDLLDESDDFLQIKQSIIAYYLMQL